MDFPDDTIGEVIVVFNFSACAEKCSETADCQGFVLANKVSEVRLLICLPVCLFVYCVLMTGKVV